VVRQTIVATAPFYRTWWFPFAIVTLLALLASLIYRARFERRLALERLRAGIATDLHDEIGSGLTQISLYGELIRRESDPRVAAWADTVGAQARGLSEALRDLVWAIDPEKESWDAVELRMKDWATGLLGPQGIAFEIEGRADDGVRPLPASVRRNVLLVFKEALHNAVRHAACQRVEVRWRFTRDVLWLCIRDDGRGFELNSVSRGNGLRNIERRASELGATVQVRSAPGKGTSIELCLWPRRSARAWVTSRWRDGAARLHESVVAGRARFRLHSRSR
jgi:signal transduction histidine kinase